MTVGASAQNLMVPARIHALLMINRPALLCLGQVYRFDRCKLYIQ